LILLSKPNVAKGNEQMPKFIHLINMPKKNKSTIKAINYYGDEVMKVFGV